MGGFQFVSVKVSQPCLDVQDMQTKEAQEEPASKTPCDVAGMDNGEKAQQEHYKANIEGCGNNRHYILVDNIPNGKPWAFPHLC